MELEQKARYFDMLVERQLMAWFKDNQWVVSSYDDERFSADTLDQAIAKYDAAEERHRQWKANLQYDPLPAVFAEGASTGVWAGGIMARSTDL